jgi:hypothetical protein
VFMSARYIFHIARPRPDGRATTATHHYIFLQRKCLQRNRLRGIALSIVGSGLPKKNGTAAIEWRRSSKLAAGPEKLSLPGHCRPPAQYKESIWNKE